MVGIIKEKWIYSSTDYADPDINENELSKYLQKFQAHHKKYGIKPIMSV